MKHTRIIVTHYGGPDALRMVEEECPEPKRGEVRVRVLAAGVSLPDIMAREGVHLESGVTTACSGRRFAPPMMPSVPGFNRKFADEVCTCRRTIGSLKTMIGFC